jgi:hypothetical protein
MFFFPFYYLLPKIEIYMNQIQKFTNINSRFSSELHTPTAKLTTFQRGPFYFVIKVFNYLPTSIKNTSHDINQFRCFKKFPSYKFILLVRGIFCLEFQYRSWLSVIILKVTIKIFLHVTSLNTALYYYF